MTFDLHQDADDLRTFFLYERWRSVDDLADHLHAPYTQEAVEVYAASAAGEGSAMFGTFLGGPQPET
jgi:quinol monooxygenase YgiN